MIITEEAYLQHFGKKGMKWGVRQAKAAGNRIKGSSPEQRAKVTSVLVGAGLGFVSARFIGRATGNRKMALLTGAVAGVSGARKAKQVLDRDRNMTMAMLSQN